MRRQQATAGLSGKHGIPCDLELVRLIGRGARSDVFEVLSRGERLAMKVSYGGDEEGVRRFETEARALQTLDDPNVVRVVDHAVYGGGVRCIFMPLLEGKTLEETLGERRLSIRRTCRLFTDFLAGLAAIHEAGWVHRDIKPSNLFVGREAGFVRPERGIVLDLELATTLGSSMTTGPYYVGTPGYLAPEQILSGQVDARTDLFALGCVLYEALIGYTAFTDDPGDVLDNDAIPLGDLDPRLDAIGAVVARALSKRPADRFASAAEMYAALASTRRSLCTEAA